MRSHRLAKVMLAGSSLVAGLILSEFLLRLLAPVHLTGMNHQPAIYVKDETIGYGYRPNSTGWMHRNFEMDNRVLINSDGFHDVDRRQGADGEALRLVAIGDSFTAAIHVPTPATWTQVLERELSNALSVPVVVINRGLDGTGTNAHAALLSSYLAAERADIALIAFTNNDVWDVGVKTVFREVYDGYVLSYQNEDQKLQLLSHLKQAAFSRKQRLLYQHAHAFRIAMKLLGKDHLLVTNFVHEPPVERYSDLESTQRLVNAFKDLRTLSRVNNVKLLIVPVPTKGNRFESGGHLRNLPREEHAQLTVVDVLPALERLLDRQGLRYDELFWKHDGHFNVLGNRIFGESLAHTLEETWLSCYIRARSNDRRGCL